MARCLQTLVLARGAMGRNPIFVSIEEYLGRNTPKYYDVLLEVGGGSWQPERDARPWIRFCLVAHYRQATTVKRRAERWSRLFALVEEEVRKRHLHDRSTVALAEAANGFRIRNATYRKSADITDALASKDLVEAGMLVPHGERRGRYYTAGPAIVELAAQVPRPGRVGDPFEEIPMGNQQAAISIIWLAASTPPVLHRDLNWDYPPEAISRPTTWKMSPRMTTISVTKAITALAMLTQSRILNLRCGTNKRVPSYNRRINWDHPVDQRWRSIGQEAI